MTSTLRLSLALIIGAVLMAPSSIEAQNRTDARSLQRVAANHPIALPPRPSMKRYASGSNPFSNPVLVGAVAGAGAALALTAVGAAKYGQNEGGGFCAPCMVQWSAISVPVGAAIGAGIGFGVKRSSRSITAAPVVTPRSAGVLLLAQF
jgi:hypothetical protein